VSSLAVILLVVTISLAVSLLLKRRAMQQLKDEEPVQLRQYDTTAFIPEPIV